MGHKHSKQAVLDGALAVVEAGGLGRLTFASVAAELGTSDRMVVYYFPSKDALVSAVLVEVGARLQDLLASADTSGAQDHRTLTAALWPVLRAPGTEGAFALYFEAVGRAAGGVEPFRSLAPALVEGWVDWLSGHLEGDPDRRRDEATAAVALIDGLLIVRQLAGAEASDRAAAALGL